MLTRNHRQEALSRAYVHAIAAHAGVSYSLVGYDYGIDISLRAINVVGNRRTDGGVQLDLQLKSTTRASVSDTQVSYDLDVDNYDDLRALEPPCPRILVVLVLPADESLWLEQSTEELTIRHCAYWISLKGRPAVATVRTIRVGIPVANVFSVAGLAGPDATGAGKERAMKFRNPWIDPRILQVRSADAQAYLLRHGWKNLGPAEDPNLLLFDGPGEGDENPVVPVPLKTDQGPGIQRMIDLVTELALFEGRYAGDVLTDILRQQAEESPASANGGDRVGDVAKTTG